MDNNISLARRVTDRAARAVKRQNLARAIGLGLGILALALLALAVQIRRQASRRASEQAELRILKAQLNQRFTGMKKAQAVTVEELQAEVARSPSDAGARWRLANAFQQLGQISNALPQIQVIAKLQPASRDAQMALGNTYLALNRLKDAETTYHQMTLRWPQDADAWQGLAAALYHQRRFSEALEAAQRATSLEPNASNEYILATSAVQAAAQFPEPGVRARQLLMARKTLLYLTHTMPTNASVFYNLGLAAAALRDPSGLSYMERAYALAPDREDITAQLATALKAAGKREQALALVRSGLRRFPRSAPLYYLLGQLLQFQGGPGSDKAVLAAFSQAARFSPNDPNVQSDLGSALLRTNHLNEAKKAFLRAAEFNRFVAFPYQQLASIFTRMGDTHRATAAATLAREMVFNDQQLKQVQQLVEHDPNNYRLHLILADRYQDMGLLGPARDEYIVVDRLQPQNPQAATGLAAVQRKLATIKSRA